MNKALVVRKDNGQKMQGLIIVVTRPDRDKIEAILEKTQMAKERLKCSICGESIKDLTRIRAIFPYHSALVCCDKFECMIACRDKLISEPTPK